MRGYERWKAGALWEGETFSPHREIPLRERELILNWVTLKSKRECLWQTEQDSGYLKRLFAIIRHRAMAAVSTPVSSHRPCIPEILCQWGQAGHGVFFSSWRRLRTNRVSSSATLFSSDIQPRNSCVFQSQGHRFTRRGRSSEIEFADHGFPGVSRRCWRKHKGGRYDQSVFGSDCCYSSCVTDGFGNMVVYPCLETAMSPCFD